MCSYIRKQCFCCHREISIITNDSFELNFTMKMYFLVECNFEYDLLKRTMRVDRVLCSVHIPFITVEYNFDNEQNRLFTNFENIKKMPITCTMMSKSAKIGIRCMLYPLVLHHKIKNLIKNFHFIGFESGIKYFKEFEFYCLGRTSIFYWV